MGEDRNRPLRPDWKDVKVDVMRDAVRAKFEQNAAIRQVLFGTGNANLVENVRSDYYWGCGADGSGKNRLGQILMEVRDSLRESTR